jgi:transposase
MNNALIMSRRKIKRRSQSPSKQPPSKPKSKRPKHRDIPLDELKRIIEKSKTGSLSAEEAEKLDGAIDTLAVVTNELEMKGATVRRLRRLLFGPSSEKTSAVFPDETPGAEDQSASKGGDDGEVNGSDTASSSDEAAGEAASENDASGNEDSEQASSKKKKRKGHGRNGAKDYTGAERQRIDHEELKAKDNCPKCLKGKLYTQKEPATLVRVTGTAPLSATVYELERLRCNLCGEVFTAKAPEGIGKEKYDLSAAIMIALLKYGCGMPFNRLEGLEKNLGIPLPSSTQWDVVYFLAMLLAPLYTEFIRQASQGDVLHNDDTTARILNLESPPLIGKNGKERTGLHTSGILSTKDGRQIAVFFTGRKYAGENLEQVLSHRNEELTVPIHMCDGISINNPGDFETISANCNSHARRKFVDIADDFVKEVKHILGVFKRVYKNDDETKNENMTADERLDYHVAHSKPLLDDLKEWFEKQFEAKDIEPNSSLGAAINYMTERWDKLTQFLTVPGVPLDNNACERVIKKAILHRKNALFFKTENGAYVADLFMTIIHTCELQGINPFDYMLNVAKNPFDIALKPEQWMPWNFQLNLH